MTASFGNGVVDNSPMEEPIKLETSSQSEPRLRTYSEPNSPQMFGSLKSESGKVVATFVSRALETIVKDRNSQKSRHSEMKNSCSVALDDLKSDSQDVDAAEYYETFRSACQSGVPSVVIVAIDCFQKIIAWDDGPLMEDMVETICDCFQGEETNDKVMLQIVKALLTAITRKNRPHGKSLLRAVSTCYNIFLASRSMNTQITAKAALNQILSFLFQKMESKKGAVKEISKKNDADSQEEPSDRPENGDVDQPTPTKAKSVRNSLSRNYSEELLEKVNTSGLSIGLTKGSDNLAASLNYLASNEDSDEDNDEDEDVDKKEETTIASEDAEGEQMEPSDNEAETNNKSENETKEDHVDNKELEKEKTDAYKEKSTTEPVISEERRFANICELDAFLVFRSICKMTVNISTPNDSNFDQNSLEIQSKVFSLKMLMVIFQHSGPVMHNHEQFISVIRRYLCISLSKTGTSQNINIIELSLSLFLCLVAYFRAQLKPQIEVMFRDIFLFILESPTSSYQHKWMVLQAMSKLCIDSQVLVDLYINYDCDLKMDNIYTRLIYDLEMIAHGRASSEINASPKEERRLKNKGLECLVTVLNSMVYWIDPLKRNVRELDDEIDPSIGIEANRSGSFNKSYNSLKGDDSIHSSANEFTLLDDPDEVETMKKHKEIFVSGLSLFNKKPKKGIAYLQQNSALGKTSEEVAQFLKTEQRLDKEKIGEYLGEADKACIEVMHIYVDGFNFEKMDFLQALRNFLSGFRLPGEAQKIDRLMEKFAARYTETNPSVFAHADTAYVLAFSVIMLTTDLHKNQIKKKMTQEEFVKNNRGINDQQDLPKEFLEEIYNAIAKEELTTKENIKFRKEKEKNSFTNEDLEDKDKRSMLYHKQMEETVENVQAALMYTLKENNSAFVSAKNIQHIRPMFLNAWTVYLACLSIPLKDSNSRRIDLLCLQGFRGAIHISGYFNLITERNAFVTSLTKYSGLFSNKILLKDKEMDVVETLIDIASDEGDLLSDSWYDLLKCFSQLDLVNQFGQKDGFASEKKDKDIKKLSGRDADEDARGMSEVYETSTLTEILNREMPLKPILAVFNQPRKFQNFQEMYVSVDRVFSSSQKLNGKAIVDFFVNCCKISLEELEVGRPRMYMLQKIVELSYYNMDRIRLEWSRIWVGLGDYFNKVGCSVNSEVAVFAVDSLKQLTFKFLERGELAHFHFQKDFFRPFEYIMSHTEYPVPIKDMILRCFSNMLHSQAHNIRSGWKNIFSILNIAASEVDDDIIGLAFNTVKEIHFKNLNVVLTTKATFGDYTNCLVEYAASCRNERVNIRAVEMVRDCAEALNERATIEDPQSLFDECWFPLLLTLHRMITRCSMTVRTRSLTILFDVLHLHGHYFDSQQWADIFTVLFRLFDTKKLPEETDAKKEWLETVCNIAIFPMMKIITQFYPKLDNLVTGFLQCLSWCMTSGNGLLAQAANQCFCDFLKRNVNNFNSEKWDLSISYINQYLELTTPLELGREYVHELENDSESQGFDDDVDSTPLEASHDNNDNDHDNNNNDDNNSDLQSNEDTEFNNQSQQKVVLKRQNSYISDNVFIKCSIHLQIIESIKSLLVVIPKSPSTVEKGSRSSLPVTDLEGNALDGTIYKCLTKAQVQLVLNALEKSYSFAHAFNIDVVHRQKLLKDNSLKRLPILLKQENVSLSTSLSVLFRLYLDCKETEDERIIGQRLDDLIITLLNTFRDEYEGPEKYLPKGSWTKILIQVLKQLQFFSDEQFVSHCRQFYKEIADISVFELSSTKLRREIANFFDRQGQILFGSS